MFFQELCRSADTFSKHTNQEHDIQSQDSATILNPLGSDNSQDYGYQVENTMYTAYIKD